MKWKIHIVCSNNRIAVLQYNDERGTYMLEKETRECRVLIIGSGPAGLSAAIYAGRAGLNPVVISGPSMGGQAVLTAEIENYPGFSESVSGSELMDKFREHAEKFGAEIVADVVEKVDFSGKPLLVETGTTTFKCERVIIATGSVHMPLNVPGEKEFTGSGVSYCATCDGFFYRKKNVAVVGGGNSAVEEADFLTRFAASVTIIHRRNELRAEKIVQEKAFANPKIKFCWDSVVTEIVGEDKVTGLKIKNVKTGEESLMPIDGVFVFVGTKTVTELFDGQLEMNGNVIKVGPDMQTSVPGVYAAGESVDNQYRQVIVSAALGAQAGISVSKTF